MPSRSGTTPASDTVWDKTCLNLPFPHFESGTGVWVGARSTRCKAGGSARYQHSMCGSGGPDHDIPKITCILYELGVSGLETVSTPLQSVYPDNHHEVGARICGGIVSKELHELLVESRRASSCVANVYFYWNARLAGQAPYQWHLRNAHVPMSSRKRASLTYPPKSPLSSASARTRSAVCSPYIRV